MHKKVSGGKGEKERKGTKNHSIFMISYIISFQKKMKHQKIVIQFIDAVLFHNYLYVNM